MATPIAMFYRHLSLTVKYGSVLFPFDGLQFIRALGKHDFLLPDAIEQAPFGARIEVTGVVGRKGEVAVLLDANKQVLAVQGPGMAAVLNEMSGVESLLRSEFDLDSSSLAQYYELLVGLTAKAKRNPLESWSDRFAQVPIMGDFSKALGADISPFGVRLARSGEVPNQNRWLEVHLEPLVQSPKSHHNIEVIFRDASRNEVFAFAERLEDTIRSLIAIVEG